MKQHALLLAAALLLCTAAPGNATSISKSSTSVYSLGSDLGLWKVDTETGSTSRIAELPTAFFDIARSSTGELYGVSHQYHLFSIDVKTGAATDIGDLGIRGGAPHGLTFDTKDTLYLVSYDIYLDSSLSRVDLDTGAASLVGAIGTRSKGDLAFAPDGTLYMMGGPTDDTLFEVDTDTGLGTIIGTTGTPYVHALEFIDDELIGLTRGGQSILRIDRETGAGTTTGSYTDHLTVGSSSIPEPMAAFVFGFGMLLIGHAARQQR